MTFKIPIQGFCILIKVENLLISRDSGFEQMSQAPVFKVVKFCLTLINVEEANQMHTHPVHLLA